MKALKAMRDINLFAAMHKKDAPEFSLKRISGFEIKEFFLELETKGELNLTFAEKRAACFRDAAEQRIELQRRQRACR